MNKKYKNLTSLKQDEITLINGGYSCTTYAIMFTQIVIATVLLCATTSNTSNNFVNPYRDNGWESDF